MQYNCNNNYFIIKLKRLRTLTCKTHALLVLRTVRRWKEASYGLFVGVYGLVGGVGL